MDLVRFLHGSVLATLGFLLLVFVVSYLVKRATNDDRKQTVNKVRNVLVVLSLAILAWFIFSAATMNDIPRKAIDRSIANDRADRVREQGKEMEDSAKKHAAGNQEQKENDYEKR